MKEIFEVNTTDIPFYDSLLKNGKGVEIGNIEVVANVEYMSPDDYFEQCALLCKSTLENQYRMISERNMQELANVIEREKLPIGFLNFVMEGQEGRHRALLAKRLGIDSIPVLVVKPIDKSNCKGEENSMSKETVKCELCNKEIEEEKAIFFHGDVGVVERINENTSVFCKSCAKENQLI